MALDVLGAITANLLIKIHILKQNLTVMIMVTVTITMIQVQLLKHSSRFLHKKT